MFLVMSTHCVKLPLSNSHLLTGRKSSSERVACFRAVPYEHIGF
jgi:hypothetical protein